MRRLCWLNSHLVWFATVGSLSTVVATGALSGFASTGTLKGALTGAFTAGLMYGVGEIGQLLELKSGGLGKIALHAGAGCASSVVGGGSCKAGAISGALGEAGLNLPDGGKILNTAKAAMLGGIGSKLAGGKFEDGARTGAFGYLFNECLHTRMCGSDSTKVAVTGNKVVGSAAHAEIQITGGYDYQILEGQPQHPLGGRLEGRSNGANDGSAFRMELTPPDGMTNASLASALQTKANNYKNELNYSYPFPQHNSPNLGFDGKGYNSNSYVSGLINGIYGGINRTVPATAARNGFSLPGWGNPIPLK